MALESGRYTIQAVATGRYIGRDAREDKSLLPKKVIHLPAGVQPPVWTVEKNGAGYIIKADGSPTAPLEGKLFAILMDEPEGELWKLERSPRSGFGEFAVSTHSGDAGWVLRDDLGLFSQISVRRLLVFPTFPPSYPPHELFRFIRAEEELAEE